MSNPAICYLIRNQIGGVYFAIEDNLGEAIHIHYGNVRFDMTIREFLTFSDIVMNAAFELFNLRGIAWKQLGVGNYKSEWMHKYKHIVSIREERVLLKDLTIKESFLKKRSIKRYIPLRESGYISLYRGNSKDLNYYEEPGVYEPSRAQKAMLVKENYETGNYTNNEGMILVDQEGYVLDGVKRASYMYYLHGGDFQIPVLRINISWDRSLAERVENSKEKIALFEKENVDENDEKPCSKKTENKIAFKVIMDFLKSNAIKHVVIEGEENNQFQCDKYVLVETDGKEKLYTFIGKRNVADAELSKYVFAYANDLPLMISTDTGEIIIHTRYLVKSKFYSNMIMPLDRTVQLWIWENEDRNHILKKDAECVLSIILCILSGEHIKRELREQAKKNKEIWKCQKVKEVMNKVFFSYGSYAMRYIYNERFNEVINEYIAFAEY